MAPERTARSVSGSPAGRKAVRRLPVLLLLLAFATLLVSGVSYLRSERRANLAKIERDLAAVARLKASQLAAWRTDQLEDAATLQQHPYLPVRVDRFLNDRSQSPRRELFAELRNLATQHDYADILLVDDRGAVLLGLEESSARHTGYLEVLADALASGTPRLTDLHDDGGDHRPNMAAVVPLHVAPDGTRRPIGALVMISDARNFLDPLTRNWPVPSRTAETLLIEARGDSVLFLSALRERPDAALSLRLPLAAAATVEAQAGRGATGIVRGKDYRGVPVLAVCEPVPETPWIMVAKIDADEAYADWRVLSRLLVLLLLGMAGFLVATGVVLRQRSAAAHYRSLYAAEAAVRKSEERFRATFEQAGEAIVITDPAGRIEYTNPAFARTSGYASEDVIGENPRLLKSGQHDDAFYREMWETISAGRVWRGRVVNRRKDGSLFTEDTSISPVTDADGRIVNYVAVKRDVTERLQLESQLRQAQTLESIGRLAGGVAHDFNNMLGVIKGQAELAKDDIAADSPVNESLDHILEATERSAGLIRQLLGFARRQTIEPRILDLNVTLTDMLGLLRHLIGEDIELRWRPGADIAPVRMDPTQLDQVLANLCINARDAIGGVGSITVETANATVDATQCAAHDGIRRGSYVLLSVRDDGCGMEPGVAAHVFEPFFSTKPQSKGTGLGLSTVYGIVHQNGGFIEVDSAPGQGTTFRLYLPCPTASAVAPPPRRAREADLPRGGGVKVLLVEDEPSIAETSAAMLQGLGYRVDVVHGPEEALRRVAGSDERYRLLITDVVMPNMNGRELARRLQDFDPELRVLYMSGYTAEVIATRGVLHEGVSFLPKPFSRRDLALKVSEVMDGT